MPDALKTDDNTIIIHYKVGTINLFTLYLIVKLSMATNKILILSYKFSCMNLFTI